MKILLQAIRGFFNKGNKNVIKVLSLAAALAIGIVLISKNYFETSYENFYPDNERIYLISSVLNRPQEDTKVFDQVSGAIAPGFQDYVPGVELATRITTLGMGADVVYSEDMNKYSAKLICADSNYFKIFPRKVLAGDVVKALAEPMKVVITEPLAQNLGGVDSAMGKVIFKDGLPTVPLTVAAVVEEIPDNTMVKYDIYLSLVSYSKWSIENWVGNDRYRAYVMLNEACDPYGEETMTAIKKMQEENQPMDRLKKAGVDLTYTLKPFNKLHSSDKEVRNMIFTLSLISFILIFAALMNYILISISTLVSKGKEVAVRKCYGASGGNIRAMMFAEASLNLFVSLGLAALIIYSLRAKIEELIGVSIESLFTYQSLILVAIVCVIVLLVAALVPAYIFEKVPVSSVFRAYKENKRKWKLALLSVQFIASSIMLSLLVVIMLQYNKMANDNPGYDYDNLVICQVNGAPKDKLKTAMAELRSLTQVRQLEASEWALPLYHASGNNILLPDSDKDLFNIADLYAYSSGYWDMMNINFLEGNAPKTKTEVIVSRSFVDKMNTFADWSSGAIGKQIRISEHSSQENPYFTICGVYEDIRVSSMSNQDKRPSIMFWADIDSDYFGIVLLKVNYLDGDVLSEIQAVLEKNIPNKEIKVMAYSDEMRALYDDSKKFRDSVLIGGLIMLIISIIGLVAYINEEILRRSKEIAIRKVNGARPVEILELLFRNMLFVSVPSLIVGSVAAYFISVKWLENFSEKTSLSPMIFIMSVLVLLIIITVVMLFRALKIARENPVKAIGRE